MVSIQESMLDERAGKSALAHAERAETHVEGKQPRAPQKHQEALVTR